MDEEEVREAGGGRGFGEEGEACGTGKKFGMLSHEGGFQPGRCEELLWVVGV